MEQLRRGSRARRTLSSPHPVDVRARIARRSTHDLHRIRSVDITDLHAGSLILMIDAIEFRLR